ncbi:MAG: hemerythrin domain-containing protein [Spirochaetia bacterium]|nr:hemerythrin domain-containing protein [Spirochaetia bacterium]
MNIFTDIENEHRLFEKAAGSMVAIAKMLTEADTLEYKQDLKALCNFFISFMVKFHTQKEEAVIFTALEKLNLPRDKGPLYYYALEHTEHLTFAEEILTLLEKPDLNDEDKKSIYDKSVNYCGNLWEHIDKEDSVFLTEVTERIRGMALIEMNNAYEKFIEEFKFTDLNADKNIRIAEDLIKKYDPVLKIPEHIRGDGCMSCRHFGSGCNGIEHEWWSEHEWEDFFERNNRD